MSARSFGRSGIVVLAPTFFEYALLRLLLHPGDVIWAGMGLSRRVLPSAPVIVCGLAGGLRELQSGTVIIPRYVGTESGALRMCDPILVDALTSSAASMGRTASHEPLLTARALVTGSARRHWAERGFAAADMETGLLPEQITRFASVRVILDTPGRSISAAWASGVRTLADRRAWSELAWMAGHAPPFALLAGRIASGAAAQLKATATESTAPVL